MKKRLLALLLCLVMVIGLVPVALADDGQTSEPEITYTIKINPNGGNLSGVTEYTLSKGSTIAEPTVTKTGYHVLRWDYKATKSDNTTETGTWNFGWPLSQNGGTVELTAIWEANTYTIHFDAGSIAGKQITGSMNDISVTYGQDVKLSPNGYSCEGYRFTGWKMDGASGLIHDEEQVKNLTSTDGAEVKLTAQWEADEQPKPLLKIKYKDKDASHQNASFDGIMYAFVDDGDDIYIDPKGGTAKLGNTIITTAGNYQVKSSMLEVDGTVHLTEPDGSLGWTFNSNTNPYSFVAVWPSTKTVTISYLDYYYGADTETIKYDGSIIVDPNGGSVVWERTTISSKQTIDYIRADAALARATRNGYTFYGWVVSYTQAGTPVFTATWSKDYYYNTYSIYYYDFEDGKSEYANFPYGTSVVIDPNGGTAKLSGTAFSTKQYFNIYRDYTLTDASRSGYTFYGWDLTKSGSTYYFTAMWSRYKSDVPYMLNGTDHYAYIKGYPNGSFKPTDTITRAEAATIFYRLLTDSTRKAYATTYNSFKDVPATAWYNTAVSTMAKLGIVNGGADGYFRPNDPITRAEIAAMIARCDGAYYTGSSTVFSDTYGHWAASYIARAYELGWINGYGTTYAPDRYISRAETVAVLNRVLNRAPQYTSDLTRNYTTFSDVATSAWYYLDVEEAANSHTYTRKSNADYETWTKLIADPSWF